MGVDVLGLQASDGFGGEIPECPHGPMLLFERASSKKAGRQFYACAACRDRKDCSFFLWKDECLKPEKISQWKKRVKQGIGRGEGHAQSYRRAQQALGDGGSYCLNCDQVISSSDFTSHKDHDLRKAQLPLTHPSQLLCPKSANKSEAQYLFSAATLTELIDVLRAAEITHVLCVAAPRVHERLTELEIPSLMLDCDRRYELFWPPEKMCTYNMFNHHFFNTGERGIYMDFVRRGAGKGLGVVMDPPFGGRVEALALTIASIQRDIRSDEGSEDTDIPIPVLLTLPYFNEPDVLRWLPDFHMTDLRIEYDNHAKFSGKDGGGRKQGSPVRLFTNLPRGRVTLAPPRYRLCQPCGRWVHVDNVHCTECRDCTSKDGRPYRHCALCSRCVKVTWSHCAQCGHCALPDHPCPVSPRPDGGGVSPPTQKRHQASSHRGSGKKKRKRR